MASVAYPMSNMEYRAALAEMGLTQARAAALFGGSERTGRRWAEQGAPYPVALLIALMQEFELPPEHLEALGRQWQKPIVPGAVAAAAEDLSWDDPTLDENMPAGCA